MPDAPDLRRIPLEEIDPESLPRDRTHVVNAEMAELRLSISRSGLRQPVEVYELPQPRPPVRFGLLSGLRRFTAVETLHQTFPEKGWHDILAFVRPATDLPETLAAMVEENDQRSGLTPWEQGHVAWRAAGMEVFPTIEAAVNGLYPTADRNRRTRLRALARLVEALDGMLTDPERLSLRQCLRIERAIRMGFEKVMIHALTETELEDPENQWNLLRPILEEAEAILPDAPAPRGDRPRRLYRPPTHHRLAVRREKTEDGWTLRFTGKDATSDLMDMVFFEIERVFDPERRNG